MCMRKSFLYVSVTSLYTFAQGEKHMKGLTHIYTGDGKGKTTAAVGLGVRPAGMA